MRPASPVIVERERALAKVVYEEASFQQALFALKCAAFPGRDNGGPVCGLPERTSAAYLWIVDRKLPVLDVLPSSLKLALHADISQILDYLLSSPESVAGRVLGKRAQSALLVGKGDEVVASLDEAGGSQGFQNLGPLESLVGQVSGPTVSPASPSAERTEVLREDACPSDTNLYCLFIYSEVSVNYRTLLWPLTVGGCLLAAFCTSCVLPSHDSAEFSSHFCWHPCPARSGPCLTPSE